MFLLHGLFPIKFVNTNIQYFFGVMRNKVQKQPLEVFCKKDVLKNFAKSTGKRLCQSLFFNRVVGLRSATLLKKKLWHRCFPVNFAKFLRTPFVQKTSGQLLIWTTASETSNTKYLELIKRRSKVLEKKCHVKVL